MGSAGRGGVRTAGPRGVYTAPRPPAPVACTICGQVSAGGDHLDCAEKRRAGAEDELRRAAEAAELAEAGIAPELKALMDRMSRERD